MSEHVNVLYLYIRCARPAVFDMYDVQKYVRVLFYLHTQRERERERRLEEDTHSLSVYSQCSNTVDSVGEELIYN
jgi:hypothetical protein